MLLEIPFYDMNCQYPFIAPGIMQELKKAQKRPSLLKIKFLIWQKKDTAGCLLKAKLFLR